MEKSTSVLQIIEELNSDNSRLFKERVLKAYGENKTLKAVLFYTYNTYYTFNIKKIPEYTCTIKALTLIEALEMLQPLMDREITGGAGVEYLKNILQSLTIQDAKVLELVIKRDLKCGVNRSTINNVFGKNYIPKFELMLCVPYNEDNMKAIKYPAISQLKEDGCRVVAIKKDGNVTFFTRSGKELENMTTIAEDIKKLKDFYVYDGELLVFGADRKEGNGLVTKVQRGTVSKAEAERLYFVIWDMIPLQDFIEGKGKTPYIERFKELETTIRYVMPNFDASKDKVQLVQSIVVNTRDEAMQDYASYLEQLKEGTILKNFDSTYSAKRIVGQVKIKDEQTCTLKVIGFSHGSAGSKYEKMLGALTCISECGKLHVSISGFTDDFRLNFNIADYINTYVDVLFNQVITSKSSEYSSLFLPRYVCDRPDKTRADLLSEILLESTPKK